MNKFRKLGFIEYNGKIEVHNSLLNVVLHDNPQIREGCGHSSLGSFIRIQVVASSLLKGAYHAVFR